MKTLFALLLLLLLSAPQAVPGRLADAPSDGVSFDFTPRPDSHQSPYIISIPVEGLARYIEFSADSPRGPAARPVLFKISDRTLQRVLTSYADAYRDATQGTCETRLKGIASSGKKLLTYYRDGHSFSCTFNYGEDSSLNGVAELFMAIASTLQFGERLQHELRFDRLGLDSEMDELVAEATDGRAIEIASIAPVLQSIIDDDRVMERVKRKAARLLQAATAPVPAAQLPRPSPR